MKKIFRNLKFGLLLCAGAFAASCSDVEDAMDEIPYTRVLTPLNFEADVDAAVGTDIKFSWSAVSNAEGYVLELFEAEPTYTTDEKGNEVENYELPDHFDSANAFASINVAKDEVPYTVKNLEVDKTFWARVKGASSRLEHSYWVCLIEPVSTSAVRKALNPQVKERTSTSVTLTWDNADDKGDLTSVRCDLVVPVEGATPKIMPLTDEQIQACEATVEDLDPCTNYKFTLLFGKSGSRGHLTAFTRPNTEGATKISSSEQLASAIGSATSDLKLELEYNDGVLYDLTSIMTLNSTENIYDPFEFAHSLEIYGLSSPEGAKPAIKLAIKPTAGCNALHFEDLLIDGGNQCGVFVTTGGSIEGDAEFVNCEITGFTKGIWSGSAGFNVTGTLLYENIYAHDINPTGAGGGDFIDIRGGDYGAVIVKNSTFYAAARTFLRVSEAATTEVGKIEVANCTFNQVTATATSSNNSGIFHVRYTAQAKPDSYTKIGSITLTKCVFLNELSATEDDKGFVRMARNNAENFAPKCEGNYYYNVGPAWFDIAKCYQTDGTLFSQTLALDGGGAILTDDPCTNSIAGKMYLKPNSAIAANKAGDPRWWNASAPVIVRPTELETVTEATEWVFTDKVTFDTEKIESNQIIENIRIYAPAEVEMSKGVTFNAAATLSIKNEPLTSALAFKADGYGAVEVTAQGTGITSTIQIIAGGDAYSINADGKTHKVVFGDLVGANYIYILPSVPNITFTKVAWTKDITPEDITETLATPELTIDATNIELGTKQAVTVSWNAVTGAALYKVTFNSATTEVTEPKFVIAEDIVAGLTAGEYKISVIAQPTETSTRYLVSEAGETSFKIKKPIVGVEKTATWDFSTFDGTNLAGDASWTSGTAFATDVVWNVNENIPLTLMNGTNCDGTQIKMGDGSAFAKDDAVPTRRAMYFKAPSAGGTLKITHKSANSNERSVYVSNGVKLLYTGEPTNNTEVTNTAELDVEEGETIYIFSMGNNIQKVEYTYYALPQTYTYEWDFSTITDLSGAQTSDLTITANGRVLNLLSTGSNLTIEAGKQIKMGGGTKIVDNIPVGRAFSFVAQGPGTLYLNMNTASSGKNDRPWWVCINNTTNKIFESNTCPIEYTVEEVDGSEVEAGQTVYIGVDGGINFKSVKWVETH